MWKGIKIRDIPSDRRLIVSRWLFRVKRNGVSRSRLIELGYIQIKRVYYTENVGEFVIAKVNS